jgi:O-antigen ligase
MTTTVAKAAKSQAAEYNERLVFWCDKVIEWGLILIAFFVPLIFTTATGADIFNLPRLLFLRLVTIPVAMAWVIRLLETRQYYRFRTPMLLPVLAVLLSWLVSSIFSLRPEISFMGNYLRQEGFWTIANVILLFFIASTTIRTTKQANNLLTTMLWSAFVTMVYGALQFFGLDPMPWGASGSRPFSSLGNPDFFPHFLIMLLPVAIMKFLNAATLELKIYQLVFVGLMAFNVVVAQTRGAYIGVLLSVPVLALLIPRATYRANKAWLIVIGVALVGFAAFLIWKMDFLNSILRGGFQQTRFYIWLGGLTVFAAYPILGVGPDVLRIASPSHKVLQYSLLEPMNNPDRMHNQYLDEMIMRGAIGFLVYLWMLVTFFWKSFKAWRETKDPYWRAMLAGIGVGVLAFCAQNLVAFGVVPVILYFWLLMALMVSLWQMDLAPAVADSKGKKVKPVATGIPEYGEKKLHKSVPRPIPPITKTGIYVLVAVILIFSGYWTLRIFDADLAYGAGEIAIQTAGAYGQQAAAETDETRKQQIQAEANRQAQLALDSYRRAVELNPWEAGYRTATEGHVSGYGNLLYQFAMTSTDTTQRNAMRDEARAQWQMALKETMYLENVYMQIGRSYQQEADEKPDQRTELLQKAAVNFEAGAQADPGDYPLYFNLATIWSELGDPAKAVQFAEKGVTYAAPTSDAKVSLEIGAQANFNYAMTLGQAGKEAEANPYLMRANELAEKLLVLDPENATAKDILQRVSSLIVTP